MTQFETPLAINDIVQVQETSEDLEYVGLIGYVSKVLESFPAMVEVSFYYAKEKGENAYVMRKEFLRPQLYLVGQPNPELLPC